MGISKADEICGSIGAICKDEETDSTRAWASEQGLQTKWSESPILLLKTIREQLEEVEREIDKAEDLIRGFFCNIRD